MAGLTLEHATAQLERYLAAEIAALSGQSYELDAGGVRRRVTRADLQWIQEGIALWDRRCKALSTKGLQVREVIPR